MDQRPPPAVLLEFYPAAIPSTGYPHGPTAILHRLFSWGYTEISHSGQDPPAPPSAPLPLPLSILLP